MNTDDTPKQRRTYRGRSDGYVVYKDGQETLVDDLHALARQLGVRPGSLNHTLRRKNVHQATGLQVRYYGDLPYNWK